METKRGKLRVFDIFVRALELLEEKDSVLYKWPRNRLALTHALSQHLHDLMNEAKQKLSVDMCPVLRKSAKAVNPDILIHNRETGAQMLAIVCRNDYLTEAEQKDLINYRRESGCELILALSFMAQKNYMLIYAAAEDKVEYYHFDRNSRTIEPVRKRSLGDRKDNEDQLTLDRILKKR
ncbi:MAG: hypothetical protein ACTTJW_07455 [Sphaerochaeta sp.]